MKNLLVITVLLFMIAGCKKQARHQLASQHFKDVVLENKSKDEEVTKRATERRGKCPPNNPHCQPPPPPPHPPPYEETKGCLLFDFNGQEVDGTLWNQDGQALYFPPSGLSATAIEDVVTKSKFYYAFNPIIKITTDEAFFNTYPQNKRRRIIITTIMPSGFQGAAGVAYLNSFNWFDDTPAFVNSSGLDYNSKWIADASSHEGGHCFGLRHHSSWQYNEDGSCSKLNEYLWGNLIMGASYNDLSPRFGIAPDNISCYQIQNDTLIINQSIKL